MNNNFKLKWDTVNYDDRLDLVVLDPSYYFVHDTYITCENSKWVYYIGGPEGRSRKKFDNPKDAIEYVNKLLLIQNVTKDPEDILHKLYKLESSELIWNHVIVTHNLDNLINNLIVCDNYYKDKNKDKVYTKEIETLREMRDKLTEFSNNLKKLED